MNKGILLLVEEDMLYNHEFHCGKPCNTSTITTIYYEVWYVMQNAGFLYNICIKFN
jgi:hypothetical protein